MRTLSEHKFRDLVTCEPHETVFSAALKMENHKVGSVIVTVGYRLLGIVTRYDFIHHCIIDRKDPKTTRIEVIMHPSPVSIEAQATSADALKRMIERRIERLVVLEGTKIIGVVSLEDIVANLEVETFESLSREKYDKVFELVKTLTPKLLSRYPDEEKEELQRDMTNQITALLRLLGEAEISLRT